MSTFLNSVKQVVYFPDIVRETNHIDPFGGNAFVKGSYVGRAEDELLSFFEKLMNETIISFHRQ
jgi:hypothetical protein